MEDEKNGDESLFGEVISSHTLKDAIEDGTHVDFGTLTIPGYRIIMTTGLLSSLNKFQLVHAVVKTLNGLSPDIRVDMVVFKPNPVEPFVEDQGRTLILHIDGLEETVYSKLEGDVVTIFLASEY